MLTTLSLRLRIFLFFAFLAVSGVVLVAVALTIGYARAGSAGVASGFVFAGVLSAFGLLALTAGIWFLFDENVARPINRLATSLRSRAHAGAGGVDRHAARYLGDLAPAAEAVSEQLLKTTMDQASVVASETARLSADKARLTALLSDIPVAMILVNASHQIVLYDTQAAGVLSQVSPPRLNSSIFDYFQKGAFLAAYKKMASSGLEQSFDALPTVNELQFDTRLKPLGPGEGYLVTIDDAHANIAPDESRPVVFDFDLMEGQATDNLMDMHLNDLTYVVFDTETTGLLPHKDEVVQIGAVRVVKGKIVPGEIINQLVDPEIRIPASSTKVHGVNDAMVGGQPTIKVAGKYLHDFARGAVLVAHNAPFDMAFLRRHANDCGVEWSHPILDTVLLSAILFGTTEEHTLDAVCQRLGVTIPTNLRHTALGDAQATAEVLCKMLAMLHSRGIETLAGAIEEAKKHKRLLDDLN
ncbi:3'-5' exonuclease [Aliiroseovarius sp. N1F302]|nr:3'-5' exonuclease [uncultured Aliiroseovarius sp.]MCI2395138.1 3'-5' exonuclease [Aliiroseovarius sediminis]